MKIPRFGLRDGITSETGSSQTGLCQRGLPWHTSAQSVTLQYLVDFCLTSGVQPKNWSGRGRKRKVLPCHGPFLYPFQCAAARALGIGIDL